MTDFSNVEKEHAFFRDHPNRDSEVRRIFEEGATFGLPAEKLTAAGLGYQLCFLETLTRELESKRERPKSAEEFFAPSLCGFLMSKFGEPIELTFDIENWPRKNEKWSALFRMDGAKRRIHIDDLDAVVEGHVEDCRASSDGFIEALGTGAGLRKLLKARRYVKFIRKSKFYGSSERLGAAMLPIWRKLIRTLKSKSDTGIDVSMIVTGLAFLMYEQAKTKGIKIARYNYEGVFSDDVEFGPAELKMVLDGPVDYESELSLEDTPIKGSAVKGQGLSGVSIDDVSVKQLSFLRIDGEMVEASWAGTLENPDAKPVVAPARRLQ